ncbi:MAG: riboflavin synthase [Phycisphaerales bacterium]|nr:riboflavin synthase [Phycisphaerales bacterium]
MFSGIIRATGRLAAVESTPAGRRLTIDPGAWGHTPGVGDSIAVSGCCLTLAVPPGPDGHLGFDAIPETLAKTTLGDLAVGDRVNLETSVTAATAMDGHVVQGHVEGVGEVVGLVTQGEYRVRVRAHPDLMPCIVPKGSVAIDGVSLTIAEVSPAGHWFEVALIPTTLSLTTLGGLKPGSKVNLETDVLARTVVHVLRNYAGVIGRPNG